MIPLDEHARREKLLQIMECVKGRKDRTVEVKAEIDLWSLSIPRSELAWVKLKSKIMKSGRGCIDQWSRHEVGVD